MLFENVDDDKHELNENVIKKITKTLTTMMKLNYRYRRNK